MGLTVLHFLPDMHIGGIMRLMYYNIQALEQKGVKNIVIFFNKNEDGKYLFDNAGIQVVHVPYTGFFSIPRVLIQLVNLTKFYKADVLHSHLPFEMRFTTILSIFTGIPLFITLHFIWENNRRSLGERINGLFFFSALKQAKRIIAVSDFVRKAYSQQYQRKTVLIHSGIIDYSNVEISIADLYKGQPKLLCVGRTHPVKGHEYFVPLVLNLKQKFPDIHLIIFTKKPDETDYGRKIMSHIKEEDLEKNISYVLDVGDPELIIKLYRAADCFVFPSISDSFPLSVLEAISFGLPVVASKVGGIPEAIIPGYNGYLFEIGDIEQASHFIEKILAPGEHVLFRKKAREQFVRNFSITMSTEKLANLYNYFSKR